MTLHAVLILSNLKDFSRYSVEKTTKFNNRFKNLLSENQQCILCHVYAIEMQFDCEAVWRGNRYRDVRYGKWTCKLSNITNNFNNSIFISWKRASFFSYFLARVCFTGLSDRPNQRVRCNYIYKKGILALKHFR